ncbi:hypothetical protein ACGF12_14100 [Kitasatospora sp. NPDC048296]|uniref:hypothetical protein n=1 Tax=Kitasatospora sp. NPDC048296 TaxID=3364048 RepID=UPI003713FB95
MPTEPARRRRTAPKASPQQPALPIENPADAWASPLSPVKDVSSLDDVAQRYPNRKLTLEAQRKTLEIYSTEPNQQGAFSLDSLDFLLVIAQFFREALPLRVILVLIAGQKAGGRVPLTQEEMATILDVNRTKVNEALSQVMEHGIVFMVKPGVYQWNPPYSYRVAEFIPGTELVPAQYVRVEQADTISKIRGDKSLPDLVRFPSLEKMRIAIDELRRQRAEERAARRRARQEKSDERSES